MFFIYSRKKINRKGLIIKFLETVIDSITLGLTNDDRDDD